MMLPAGMPLRLDDFDRCWPWLEGSLAWSGYPLPDGAVWPTHRKQHVLQRIIEGRAQLWPGDQAVFLTEIIEHPSGLRSQSNWAAGGDLDEIRQMMPSIEAYGRVRGCQRQIGMGRKGWLRVFEGYEELGYRKQKDLLK